MATKTNNANRTASITVRFYAPGCCAPVTFMQEIRDLAPAFCITFLFAGALVVGACAFAAIVTMAAAIVNAVS